MDDDILRQRSDSDKIFSYIAGREKKDLLKEMKPELPVHLCEKDSKALK
ncbi:hypothetical protein ACFOJF_05030 [Pseudocitrobacter faecalis]